MLCTTGFVDHVEVAEVCPVRIVMAAVIQYLQLNFECAANVSSTSTASRKELSWYNQVDWKPNLRRCLLRWTCLRQHVCDEIHGYGKHMTERHAWYATTL